MEAAIAVTFLLLGLVLGMILHYIVEYRPLLHLFTNRQTEYFDMLYRMKRQGFVPQFDIEQKKHIDLTDGVIEF